MKWCAFLSQINVSEKIVIDKNICVNDCISVKELHTHSHASKLPISVAFLNISPFKSSCFARSAIHAKNSYQVTRFLSIYLLLFSPVRIKYSNQTFFFTRPRYFSCPFVIVNIIVTCLSILLCPAVWGFRHSAEV